MNVEPTVFIDLGQISIVPARKSRLLDDPLAPDIIKVKDEPEDVEPSNISLQSTTFVPGCIKLEGFTATQITSREMQDPLAFDCFEIKTEPQEISVSSREPQDPLAFDSVEIKTEQIETSGITNELQDAIIIEDSDIAAEDTIISADDEPTETGSNEDAHNSAGDVTRNDNIASTIQCIKRITLQRDNTISDSTDVQNAATNSNTNNLDCDDCSANGSTVNINQNDVSQISKDEISSVSENLKRASNSQSVGVKRRKVCLDTQINYGRSTGSSRKSRNSLLTALDSNMEAESFREILETLLNQPEKVTDNKITDKKSVVPNKVKTVKKIATKSFKNLNFSKQINLDVENGCDLNLNALPSVKNCSVVLKRIDVTNLNLNPNCQSQNKINKKSKDESKLLSLQLFKEISKVNMSANSDSKISESISPSTCLSNLTRSQSQTNRKKRKIINKRRSKSLKGGLSKKNKLKVKFKSINKSKNVIKQCLRDNSKSINYNDSGDEDDFEKLINDLNKTIAIVKPVRNKKQSNSTKKSKIKLHSDEVKVLSNHHQYVDGKILESEKTGKYVVSQKENVADLYGDSVSDISEKFSDLDHSVPDEEIDDNPSMDPDWIVESDHDSVEEEVTADNEVLFCISEITDEVSKPLITIDSQTKNYGKHPVLKNQESIERIKNEILKQSTNNVINPDEFMKMIETLVSDSGIVKNNIREDNGEEMYYCEFCDYSTKSEVRLMRHISMHFSNIKRYNCQYCKYSSNSPHHTNRHMNLIHGIDLIYRCKICEWVTNNKEELVEHKKQLHNDPKPFICQDCSYKTDMKYRLVRHINHVHSTLTIKPYSCDECGSKFDDKHHLKRHSLCHLKESNYICRVCNYKGKRILNVKTNTLNNGKDDLIKHMLKVHNTHIYKCELCDYTSNENYIIQHHLKYTHNKIRNYSCDLCSFKAVYKMSLQVHIETVHDKLRRFECHICDQKFGRKGELERHMTCIHIKSIVFKCEFCQFQTSRKRELSYHKIAKHSLNNHVFKCHYCDFSAYLKKNVAKHIERMHDVKRPYFCIYCKFKCSNEDDLKKHTTKHEKDRPHKCTLCHYMAATKSNLVQHIKGKHEKTKDFTCFYCDWSTGRKEHLIRHITVKHDFVNNPTSKTTFTYNLKSYQPNKNSNEIIKLKKSKRDKISRVNNKSFNKNFLSTTTMNIIQPVVEIQKNHCESIDTEIMESGNISPEINISSNKTVDIIHFGEERLKTQNISIDNEQTEIDNVSPEISKSKISEPANNEKIKIGNISIEINKSFNNVVSNIQHVETHKNENSLINDEKNKNGNASLDFNRNKSSNENLRETISVNNIHPVIENIDNNTICVPNSSSGSYILKEINLNSTENIIPPVVDVNSLTCNHQNSIDDGVCKSVDKRGIVSDEVQKLLENNSVLIESNLASTEDATSMVNSVYTDL